MKTIRTPSDSTARAGTPGQRLSHGLVALSSAVVLAVYSAGYVRTQDAADRLEADAGQRRPVMPAAAAAATATPQVTAARVDAPSTTIAATPAEPEAPAVPPAPAAPEVGIAKATPAVVQPVGGGTDPAAAIATPESSASAAPVSTSVTTPAGVTPTDVTAVVTTPEATTEPAATITATTPVIAPVPGAPAAPHYKDGTYTGWGTSRHGDIEAQVIIANGRITSATISQCMTRWPCSWIEALPGQVVARQSPETDFVSGATQSTNAFYYAVVQALGKAALP